MQTKFEDLERLVREWAFARDIPTYSTPQAQLLKAVEELGELASAELKANHEGRVDGVGDVMVCLIIYCQMWNMDVTKCLAHAYEEIKDRKGKVISGGAFVKE
jgi:NTP pyrophosphatase (non-canonical NTP hydrolase)